MDLESRVEQLLSHADLLANQFKQGDGHDLIDKAIILDHEALKLCPPNHPWRAFSLTRLAFHLGDRYGQFGDMSDIEEGIILDRAALELRPLGHPDRYITLNNLALHLSARYEQFGRVEDLEEAVALDRDAVALCPQGHPDRAMRLSNLAGDFHNRYEKLGIIEDLDEAIALGREALGLCLSGDPDHSITSSNLAVSLNTRYQKLGAIDDLNEAIMLNRGALATYIRGHPGRSQSLNNLATDLHTRSQKLDAREDLDEAISLIREALELRPPGHPTRDMSLNNLAMCLQTRYSKIGTVEDLDESISLDREALALRLPGHPDRSMSLGNLANDLYTRYLEFGGIEDLDEATACQRDALTLRLPGHPDRSECLKNLASYLYARSTWSREPQYMEESFLIFSQLADIPQVVSSTTDLSAAKVWIDIAEQFQHSTTLLAYETSLRLLVHHLATLPCLPHHFDLVKNLTSSLAVDAFSACLRNCSLTKAVELLEQGRGVFLSQLSRLRSPVDDVTASGPEGKTLADRFMHLSTSIRDILGSPGVDQHDPLCRLNLELQRVLSDIRKLPGLSHFLLAPPFSDLRKAAICGPVVILNASKYGCDALIVLYDQDPVHVALQVTRDDLRELLSEIQTLVEHAKVDNVAKYIAVKLRTLWERVVCPIVDVLEIYHPPQSRIWWCPTAEFTLLPLHAAGMYRKGQRTFSDIYMSSYTSSLTALIRARRNESSHNPTRFAAIGQANAAGESELHAITTELDNIRRCVQEYTTFTRIEGPASSISQVIDALGTHEWVHLACHGLPNRERPFESAFGLYDGHLTIQRIIQCELPNPRFAYLSACHTTVGDKACPDEMIYLASAMQFIGFRSVVGTMWAVDDEQATKIATRFYKHMVDESGQLDHTRAAFALHKTMQELVGLSFDQRILYVHFGA